MQREQLRQRPERGQVCLGQSLGFRTWLKMLLEWRVRVLHVLQGVGFSAEIVWSPRDLRWGVNDSGLGTSCMWFECPTALPRLPVYLPSSSPLQAVRGLSLKSSPSTVSPDLGKCTLLLTLYPQAFRPPGARPPLLAELLCCWPTPVVQVSLRPCHYPFWPRSVLGFL